MNADFQQHFLAQWEKYFPQSELPIAYFYSDNPDPEIIAKPVEGWRCLIADLARVRKGRPTAVNLDSIGCRGGKYYAGFSDELAPQFPYFLSYGIPGKLEGERYKKSPEIVEEIMKGQPRQPAAGKYLVFKRWDQLADADEPRAVVFFAAPDVLSGLFTLAQFDETISDPVIIPFSSGCSSIISHPLAEVDKPVPRAVVGLLDVSARPYVAPNVMTFAIPMAKFERMVANMDESFLITESWGKMRERLLQP
ncbi:MAG: DUF169 domain-containing protein [Candidatus Lernaella stagnicola]|nr:DUF169 domain-containing protein [Candidatus Lernaella stagnicola]